METGSRQGSAGEQAARSAKEAKETLSQGMKDAQAELQHAAAEIQETGATFVQERKGQFAQQLAGTGNVLRDTASRLREENDRTLADYADRAARYAEGLSGYVRDKSLSDMAGDAEQLTRRQPQLVLGSLFVAGLTLGRFLKASSKGGRAQPNRMSDPSRSDSFPGDPYRNESWRSPDVMGSGTLAANPTRDSSVVGHA